MGDPRRFDLFANLIQSNFPPTLYPNVADIAGGKGVLAYELRCRGYKSITFDKRRRASNVIRAYAFRHLYFGPTVKEGFSLLVGMHPDEATDVIIVEAAKRSTPFVICPCCVKPSAVQYFGDYNYQNWLKHLEKLAKSKGYDIEQTRLKMNGKAICLIGRFR